MTMLLKTPVLPEREAVTAAARVVDAVKVYGRGDTAVRALDGVDVDFERGRFTAIMGPSGSGKSTLHCIAGLDTLTYGSACIGDVDLGRLDDRRLTRLRRDRIGFVFQAFNLLPTLGLSMDYHVFLLSRIREHYDQTGDNTGSVAYGLRTTAGIITGAALIMVAVFGGFASGRMAAFQQMGFGLAAAVLIDATLVRSVLVPASMKLLGNRNWYLPRWLEWLPQVSVEGPHARPPEEAAAEPVGAGRG